MDTLKTWVQSRWFAVAVGIVLIAALIWLGGPYLGIGDRQPLTSPAARLALILAIVLVGIIVVQVVAWHARRKVVRLSVELAGQDADLRGEDPSTAERTQLQRRFSEAIQTLRNTRKNGRNLYALPWYVVIGPPGSGKSTLLQNSGLEFPLSDRFGKDALRGIGGTRDCDWWFTDEAVFLDTAGRYTTQDSDRVADASAWQAFLALLRRYRRRRPLNGAIVTMSVSDLLTLDGDARRQHIRSVRRRLDELTEHLGIAIPVYLMLTKCDLVAGFGEYFEDLGPDLRRQVWGVTFPAEASLDGTASLRFADEFDLLLDRLNTRLIERLHAERDRSRRAAVLSFPQQLGALREIAREFVEEAFGRHEYGKPPVLRGAYLTSGTQEGAPIDRMLGAVARTFGVDAARVRSGRTQRRTYFVERLLKDVLFRESGFAGTNQRIERRKLALQASAYLGTAILTAALVAGMATSYTRNRLYVDEVQDALKDLPDSGTLAHTSDLKTYFARALARLEVIASAQDVAGQYSSHIPWSMRFGLFQGRALLAQMHDAYLRELDATLLPGVDVRFRENLSAQANDPQALYDDLKGYLMLGEPQHRNASELTALARIEWQAMFAQDPAIRDALDRHFSTRMNDPRTPRALPLDNGLVDQARATLKTADLATLIYGSVKLDAARAGTPPIRLDRTLGLLGNVFRRKSGVALSEPLPMLFTRPMFAAEAGGGIDASVNQFVADYWVFGPTKIDPLARSRYEQQVLALYERDYIASWDSLLADLELQPVASIQDASALAAKLSGPSSALKALLDLVRDNTHDMLHSAPGDSGKTTANDLTAQSKTVGEHLAVQRASNTRLGTELRDAGATWPTNGVSGQGATASSAQPGASIEAHFASIDALVDGTPGSTPIDHTIGVLDQLGKTLLTMNDLSDPAVQNSPALLAARQETSALPPQIGGVLSPLTGKSADLVATGTRAAVGDQFRAAAGNDCASFVDHRYPFDTAGATDIPLQNFAELFGNGGRFDTQFKSTLSRLVDTSGKNWRWKPGAPSGPDAVLSTAQTADEIREIYFRNGAQVQVGFALGAPQLDPAIAKVIVEVDGQKFDSSERGTSGTPMTWPGPQPGHVVISAFDTAGQPVGTPLHYEGDWAWMHALDAARLQKQNDLRFIASFDFAGHTITLPILPASLRNPFADDAVRRFRCPR